MWSEGLEGGRAPRPLALGQVGRHVEARDRLPFELAQRCAVCCTHQPVAQPEGAHVRHPRRRKVESYAVDKREDDLPGAVAIAARSRPRLPTHRVLRPPPRRGPTRAYCSAGHRGAGGVFCVRDHRAKPQAHATRSSRRSCARGAGCMREPHRRCAMRCAPNAKRSISARSPRTTLVASRCRSPPASARTHARTEASCVHARTQWTARCTRTDH